MVYKERALFGILVFNILINITHGTCPPRCNCQTGRVLCENLTSSKDLTGIPDDTPKLYIFGGLMKGFRLDVVKNLKKLEYLSLNTIQLKKLPNNLSTYLPSVTELNLPRNEIEYFTMLEGYENVKELKLVGNKIKQIPAYTFKYIHNLKSLSLDGNKIKYISEHSLYGLKNLQELDLSRNNIFSIHPKAFYHLPNIKKITLDSNQLESIPSKMFSKNMKLRNIFLQDNNIKNIGKDAFSNLNVSEIKLRSNKLRVIPADAFTSINVQNRIYMDNNRFHCSCNLVLSLQTSLKALFENHKLSLGECVTHTNELKDIRELDVSTFDCNVCDINPCPKDFKCNIKNSKNFEYKCISVLQPPTKQSIRLNVTLEVSKLEIKMPEESDDQIVIWVIISVVAAIVILITGFLVWIFYQRRRRSTFDLSMDNTFGYKKVIGLKNDTSIYLTMVTPTKSNTSSDVAFYSS